MIPPYTYNPGNRVAPYIGSLACTDQQNQIISAIQNKTIVPNKVVTVGDVNVYIGDGWVNVTVINYVYVLVYNDHNSDPNYNFQIVIVKAPGVVIDCNGVTISKTDKNGVPSSDNTIPDTVMSQAVATLPTSCGSGVWDGCTVGIQNKYLIVGGAAVAGYFLLKRK